MYLLMPLSCISSSDAESVGAIFATTAVDGKTYQVEYYNLDMSMSVGYSPYQSLVHKNSTLF